MRLLYISVALLLLSGCLEQAQESTPIPIREERGVIESIPSELSISYFSSMYLSGSLLTLDKVLEKNSSYTKYAVSYRSNGLKVTGVLLIPEASTPSPVVIFNHGYIDPAVYTQGRGLKREQDFFAKKGLAVFHTDYRGHAGSDPSPMKEKVYDGNLEYAMDSANAILALREAKLATLDTERIGMLGHSMGGGVTLAILTAKPEMVNAAVLYAPVHADVWENFSRWRRMREEGDLTLKLHDSKESNPTWWNRLSPASYISEIKTPIMLFHGTSDKDVPIEWSQELERLATNQQKKISYIEYVGEGHEFSREWSDFMERSVQFFKENL